MREQFVRAFAGDVVRPGAATRSVTPMPESGDETPARPEPGGPSPTYEPSRSAVFGYRQRTAEGTFTGVVATMDVAAFADGRVRGHEQVQPDRVAALVRHLRAGPARLELVTTLHRSGPAFAALLARGPTTEPLTVVTGDGVRHAVWRVDAADDLLSELSAATHYVADGHHRVAASLSEWEQGHTDPDPGIGVVAYALDGLALEPFHRLLVAEPGEVLQQLRQIAEVAPDRPDADLRVRAGGRWYALDWPRPRPAGAAGFDAARLEAGLSGPDGPVLQPTRMGVDELEATADRLDIVGFALTAPPVEAVVAVSDAGESVPAKSTYFRPKPASGLLVPAPLRGG